MSLPVEGLLVHEISLVFAEVRRLQAREQRLTEAVQACDWLIQWCCNHAPVAAREMPSEYRRRLKIAREALGEQT